MKKRTTVAPLQDDVSLGQRIPQGAAPLSPLLLLGLGAGVDVDDEHAGGRWSLPEAIPAAF